MCFFKKKKKIVITNNKYRIGETISFKYRDDVTPGIIYDIKLDKDNKVIYDINIGGECPAIITGVKEEDVFLRR